MNVKRILIFTVVALLVCFVCTSCGSGGPVSTVKGCLRAFRQGDVERINMYFDEGMQIDDDVSNIWEGVDPSSLRIDLDSKDIQRIMGKNLKSAKYKLSDQEDNEATVEVTLNTKAGALEMMRSVKDKDIREEMAEKLKELDPEEFIKTLTFELELIDGKWLITNDDWVMGLF